MAKDRHAWAKIEASSLQIVADHESRDRQENGNNQENDAKPFQNDVSHAECSSVPGCRSPRGIKKGYTRVLGGASDYSVQ